MIDLARTRRFDRDFDGLPERLRSATLEKLRLFATSPRHPSLRLKRVGGTQVYWELSVTMQYRVVLEFITEDYALLHRVGTHRILDGL